MSFKLIAELPLEDAKVITEASTTGGVPTLYLSGPFMGAEMINRNMRNYALDAMKSATDKYIREYVMTGRAMGELNHPATPEVNPERACMLVTEITQDNTVFFGKAKVTTSPIGQIVRCLLNDGVKLGVSSRALGKLEPMSEGVNRVTAMDLRAIDCVADPSFPKAFVNGILESTQFVLDQDGRYEPIYDSFKKSIQTLPKKELDKYLREQVVNFIANVNKASN